MKKVSVICMIFLASCLSHSRREVHSLFDENSLKIFLQNAYTLNESDALIQLDSLLTTSSKDSSVFHQTIIFLQAAVSNPNSRFRNDKMYIKILQAQLQSSWFNVNEKKSVYVKLKLLQQNNVGFRANDFTYIIPTGEKRRIYEINAKFLLLYFNNPECPACKELKMALENSATIKSKIENHQLTILSIYPDNGERIWLHYLPQYPKNWLHGRDDKEYIFKNGVYDLRAIPSIYLLDENKIVLLKDCFSITQVEQALMYDSGNIN